MSAASFATSTIPSESSVRPERQGHPQHSTIEHIVAQELAPLTVDIDLKGRYPRDVMKSLGQAGAFSGHLQGQAGHGGLYDTIDAMGTVARECMSTGFAVWCQDTCAWYIENTENQDLKARELMGLASGAQLAGTGLSNPMKFFSEIEALKLWGERVDGGYIINGSLPWVSNLGPDHVFGTVFGVKTPSGSPHLIMALFRCNAEGFKLGQLSPFVALEGTGTYACHCRDLFIPDADIIADPVKPYVQRARCGFIMLQAGMGLGVIQGCIDIMHDLEPMLGHVNRFLDDRPEELTQELDDLWQALNAIAATPWDISDSYFKEVLELRLAISELTLRATQSAMLHAGARGYQLTASAQRRLREGYFVAIITPAIKHLRKEIARLSSH